MIVTGVMNYFQAKIPHLSDKELAMAREVSSLDRKVQSLEGGVKQLKEKEKYQRYQIGVEGRLGSSSIKDNRLDNIKEVLPQKAASRGFEENLRPDYNPLTCETLLSPLI